MGAIARQREIIDGLRAELSAAVRAEGSGTGRVLLVAILRKALAAGRAEIRRRFEAGGTAAAVMREQCFLMDQLIHALFDVVIGELYPLANPTAGEKLALVAVGGYGRGELAPCSDIDLLFLLPYKRTPHTEQVVEALLYVLWDLGLKIGHAVRSVEDCLRHAKSDLTVRTSLLELRFLRGDEELFGELKRRFDLEIARGTAAQFIEAKLAERDERHRREGDSRYKLEPNVKEGKGGLRDLHTLFWLAKYIYRIDDVAKLVDLGVLSPEESHRFARAQDFLWTVRCHLHYLTGRAEERLTFDLQTEIGRRMGYTDHAGSRGVERFMKHYFLIAKDVGDLTRIFCAILEADQRRRRRLPWVRWGIGRRGLDGFVLDGERLTIPAEDFFAKDPVALIRLLHIAQRTGLDIHPRALRRVGQSLRLVDAKLRDDPEANRLFLDILTSPRDPESALRRMNEAGVLGRFIPDFGRVVAQMQYDMYHHYTVDEHTLFAIGILHKIESGQLKDEAPLSSSLIGTIASRRALYVAVLLHDIAKGRGGDHSVLGEKIALRLGPRFGLSAGDRDRRVAGALAPADEQHRLQTRHLRPAHDRRFCRAGAVAGTAEAVADPDLGQHPRGRAASLERVESRVVARPLRTRDRGHVRRAQRRAAGCAGRRGPGGGARKAAGFQRERIRRLCQGGLSVLLAVLRRRDPRPACAADARGVSHRGAAGRREAG